MPIWVINTDLTRDLVKLIDPQGKSTPFQVVDYPVCNAELSVLAEVETPACGYATLRFEWDETPTKPQDGPEITNAETAPYWRQKYRMFDQKAIDTPDFELASDTVKITLKDGHIVAVSDLAAGTVRTAPEGASFLEPVCYPISRENWNSWFTESIPDDPERFVIDKVYWDEAGPLRWRITRTGKAGGFRVRQHIDLIKGERGVRSTVQFVAPGDNSDALIALSIPVAQSAAINVDIPFGIEPRNIGEISYGSMERTIPGFFWGRTWANARDEAGQLTLIAEDGDKFFRAYGSPRRLVHFMAQKVRIFEKGWESYTDTFDTGGRQVFQHRMALADADAPLVELVNIADSIRHPLRYQYAPASEMGKCMEWISVSPATVSMSALACESGEIVMRLVQSSSEPAEVEISLPFHPAAARLVDLNGDDMDLPITLDGWVIRLEMKPWQIATLKLSLP
jgi:hypothetical protein